MALKWFWLGYRRTVDTDVLARNRSGRAYGLVDASRERVTVVITGTANNARMGRVPPMQPLKIRAIKS